ncbi:MAG TPA: RNA methyltransferase [Pseudomonadales bacterium]
MRDLDPAHRGPTVNFGDNIRIVLVATTHPGNIGAAARAMKNMGLRHLVLVAPKTWPALEALSMAGSALDVIDGTRVVDTLQQAIADCHLVIGTSARLRNMPVPLLDPETCAATVLERPAAQQIALVFGREASGLTNDELLLCHYHVHIPVNDAYPSLNLGAAVMVLCYELRKRALARHAVQPVNAIEWDQEPATMDELEHYLAHLDRVLSLLQFHKSDRSKQLLRRLRRLYQRIQPDRMEINILRGILTATEEALDGRRADPGQDNT